MDIKILLCLQHLTTNSMNNNRIEELIDEAKRAAGFAYAKYSNFPVGAALLNKEGKVYTGCNVENISFGLTNCAERTAIFKAASDGSRTIDTIVIYTPTDTPTPPCGACRQVIAEFSSDAKIISVCNSDLRIETTIKKLLPESSFPVDLSAKK